MRVFSTNQAVVILYCNDNHMAKGNLFDDVNRVILKYPAVVFLF